jgi:hypothetical protein
MLVITTITPVKKTKKLDVLWSLATVVEERLKDKVQNFANKRTLQPLQKFMALEIMKSNLFSMCNLDACLEKF